MGEKHVSVIGAGISGMVAASILADRGYAVDLFEKNEVHGGRIRRFVQDGFTFDMGPSWYWMPDIIEEHFNRVGHTVSDFYTLVRLDPSYAVFWNDEEPLHVPADIRSLSGWMETREPGSSRKLERFLDEAEKKYHLGMGKFAQRPFRRFSDYLDPRLVVHAFRMDLFRSMHRHLRHYFRDPKIIALLGFPVLFLGGTARQIPALYSLMNYADMKLGTWYPEGGMASLTDAWYQIARERGVRFHFGKAVNKIVIDHNRVSGTLAGSDNRFFKTDALVSAGDYHHTEQTLLPEHMRKYSSGYWQKRTLAPSAILFYIGVGRKLPRLLHHNLFFDEDPEEHSRSIYTNPEWPDKPLFYVCCPSKTDPGTAPGGCENLFILIPVAPGLQEHENTHQHYFELVMKRLEKHLKTDIRTHILLEKSFGIGDFRREYNSYKGNAYGLANTLRQTAGLKPSMVHNKISNLVFAGQMTHPGPGIPPSMISGRLAADLIGQSIS